MSPQPKGRRESARRLAAWMRERARVGDDGQPTAPAAAASDPASDDAAARLDAARRRLRSTISPRPDDEPE